MFRPKQTPIALIAELLYFIEEGAQHWDNVARMCEDCIEEDPSRIARYRERAALHRKFIADVKRRFEA